MGLFDEQVIEVRRFLEEARRQGKVREFRPGSRPPWQVESSIILAEDTALELGNPSVASLSVLIWAGTDDIEDGLSSLVGPDVSEAAGGSIPFAQVLIASGSFADEYECYREIRDAVYDTHLKGFVARTMPSKQSIWCRVGRDALENGFSLADLGASLISALKTVEYVTAAQALFITSSREEVEEIAPAASGARRKVEAMMKMYEEKNFDCEKCEYRDVCESVIELKKMRAQLAEGGAG